MRSLPKAKSSGVQIDSLLFKETYVHGLVGDINLNKSVFKIITLSGGGIDSFVSTILALEMLKKQHYREYLRRQEDNENDDDDVDYEYPKFEIHLLCTNYGQQSANAELVMTHFQADYFKYQKRVQLVKVYEVSDGLMDILRNPLANRAEQQEGAKIAGTNYASNDDYVPNRNARFVFNAAGLAETIGADVIVLGAVGNVNQDNSLAFLETAYATIKQSNRDHFPVLYAPFVLLTKSMVAIAASKYIGVDKLPYFTTSCFDADDVARSSTTLKRASKVNDNTYVLQCGRCRSCTSLKQAFKFANVKDPYFYQEICVEVSSEVESTAEQTENTNKKAPKPIKTQLTKIGTKSTPAKIRDYGDDEIFDDEDDED